MTRFLVRRVIAMFISVIGATVIIFVMTRLGPDPIDLYLGLSLIHI